jgi:glycerophosphoryl diester phosphodiesterase
MNTGRWSVFTGDISSAGNDGLNKVEATMKRKIGLSAAGLALALYFILAWRVEPVPPHPYFDGPARPWVIAHQGGERLFPSNTLLAMQGAANLGVDVLEMDVRATRDGALVVIHDETVDRFTNGTGVVSEMSFADLRQLDAGYYWTNDDGATYPYRGQGVVVPTLDEILAAFPDTRCNIEIKQVEPPIATAVCAALRQRGRAAQALVGSFHETVVLDFRAACPEVATAMVEAEIRPLWILNALFLGRLYQPPAGANAIQVPERGNLPLLGEVQVVTPRLVRAAHRHNIEIHVWTVNETADMERLLATGIDGIITDRPDRALRLLGR